MRCCHFLADTKKIIIKMLMRAFNKAVTSLTDTCRRHSIYVSIHYPAVIRVQFCNLSRGCDSVDARIERLVNNPLIVDYGYIRYNEIDQKCFMKGKSRSRRCSRQTASAYL